MKIKEIILYQMPRLNLKGFKAKISLDHGIKQLINLYSKKDFKPNKNF